VLPGECVAHLAGELLKERPLGPPVALAERMDRVDLAQVVGQLCDERFPVQVTKAILAAQRAEDLRRRRLYVPGQAEQAPFGDGDRPDLPRPIVDVPEDPPVDRAQVRQVVASMNMRLPEQMSAAWVISRSAASSSAAVPSLSLLSRTPVTGSAYGSSATYGCRYRATVLRYSSAALISPST
jgi:hypothetical protein